MHHSICILYHGHLSFSKAPHAAEAILWPTYLLGHMIMLQSSISSLQTPTLVDRYDWSCCICQLCITFQTLAPQQGCPAQTVSTARSKPRAYWRSLCGDLLVSRHREEVVVGPRKVWRGHQSQAAHMAAARSPTKSDFALHIAMFQHCSM